MSKLTLSQLNSNVAGYVKAAVQAGAWSKTTDNMYGLVDKIGKIVTLDGGVADKLPELDGDELPFGKTIEEYFVDFTLPVTYASLSGADSLAQYLPDVETPAYSTTIGRYIIPTSVPYNNFTRAALNANDAANMTTKIMDRLNGSYTLYKYQLKKQLLGQMIGKAAAANLSTSIAKPVDTESGEAFIKEIKNRVEDAAFANEGNCLAKCLCGATPEGSLTLYVKKGVMSSVDVDTMAGAFNSANLAIPAKVKVVDDFGDADSKYWAILVDNRGVKLHRDYHAIRSQEVASKDEVNFFDHSEHTGFISKFTYVHVFEQPAA